jgi:hypothetical protein
MIKKEVGGAKCLFMNINASSAVKNTSSGLGFFIPVNLPNVQNAAVKKLTVYFQPLVPIPVVAVPPAAFAEVRYLRQLASISFHLA